METDTNFSVARRSTTHALHRHGGATKATSYSSPMAEWQNLHDGLETSPGCRPGAVERAKALIADPGFPSGEEQRVIAEHLASHLLDDGASI